MDIGGRRTGDISGFEEEEEERKLPRELPDDLPRSLNDRRSVPVHYAPETEMYDAWQGTNHAQGRNRPTVNQFPGQSQFLTAPVLAKPLQFSNLSLDDPEYGEALSSPRLGDSENRLVGMLAAQAAHRDGSVDKDENAIATNQKLSEDEKKGLLQRVLNMAASNGDVERIQKILGGRAKSYVDVDAPDEEGTSPIIYASCFVSMI
jgi:hypothetical protein